MTADGSRPPIGRSTQRLSVRGFLLALLLTLFIDLHVTALRLPSILVALTFLGTAGALDAVLWLLQYAAY